MQSWIFILLSELKTIVSTVGILYLMNIVSKRFHGSLLSRLRRRSSSGVHAVELQSVSSLDRNWRFLVCDLFIVWISASWGTLRDTR
jgi:hypothetical protein